MDGNNDDTYFSEEETDDEGVPIDGLAGRVDNEISDDGGDYYELGADYDEEGADAAADAAAEAEASEEVSEPEVEPDEEGQDKGVWHGPLNSFTVEHAKLTDTGALRVESRGIQRLPRNLGDLTGMRSLYMAENYVRYLPATIVECTDLLSLDISNNNIWKIDVLAGLPQLVVIEARGNRLRSFTDEFGSSLTNVTVLNLANNWIFRMPETIGNMTKLTRLSLALNRLKFIPRSIGQLTNLTFLSLYCNRLVSIPEEISNLDKLTVLDLHRNRLKKLPDSICEMTNLTKIILTSNRLESLPDNFSNLSNVTELFIDRNYIEQLPPMAGFVNLTGLFMQFNKCTELPADICECTTLKVLVAYKNRLVSVPEELGRLTELTRLSLSYNNLTGIPTSLAGCEKIKTLKITNNPELMDPSPFVVDLGAVGILKYLRERREAEEAGGDNNAGGPQLTVQ